MRPLGAALALLAALCAAGTAHADTSHLTLRVISARTAGGHVQGAPVGTYRWIINEDNSANPLDPVAECRPATNAAFPAGCEWPSIQTIQGWSPIVTQGNQDDLNATAGIDLPPGRYLISVLGEDHKIDGVHFSVPLPDPGLVTVAAQPYPLPLLTLRVQVYADNAPTNGQWDVPAEDGLRGFKAHLKDVLDEVSTDWFGNPLCTVYRRNGAGRIIFDADGSPVVNENVDNDGCVSGADGIIEIPNLGPNRYAVTVIPPDGRTGFARPRSRAVTTGTRGSPRARPATTPSSSTPASRRRSPRPASSDPSASPCAPASPARSRAACCAASSTSRRSAASPTTAPRSPAARARRPTAR